MMSDLPLFQLQGLAKSFGNKTVLRHIDLDVHPKESLVILGPSGCGKSVLLKLILGLVPKDSGTILLEGKDISKQLAPKRNPFYRRCGMLFQYSALFDSLPVWHNIAFNNIMNHHWKEKDARDLAVTCLEDVGLDADAADLFPAEISGGMRKRVALARAIAGQPDILFCDEPTAGLDPIMAHLIDHLIASLSLKNNTTVVTITHDMNSVKRLAHRVVLLHEGCVLFNNGVNELFRSTDPIVEQFVQGRIDILPQTASSS